MNDALLCSIDAGVALLTMNRPQARNALAADLREAWATTVPRVLADVSVRAIVITGAGGAFCAGGDLRAMDQLRAGMDVEGWRRRMQEVQPWLKQLLACDRPVIAAVDGPAYGAGFSLALAADFVLATPQARFCLSFMRVGLVPDFAAMYTLPRVVGVMRARELMLSAREVGAEEALRLGIALELHTAEALLPRALEMARALSAASPLAVSLVKEQVGMSLAQDVASLLAQEAQAQALCFQTDAHRQAVQRFLDKQPALYRWPEAGPD